MLSFLASTLDASSRCDGWSRTATFEHPDPRRLFPDAPGPTPPGADELLDALDPEQRAVAAALRGPVRVLAGAGTGKTRAITHRIAYGVASGVYNPTEVLAVTFTTRAAGEMRTRLRGLGAGGGAGPHVPLRGAAAGPVLLAPGVRRRAARRSPSPSSA